MDEAKDNLEIMSNSWSPSTLSGQSSTSRNVMAWDVPVSTQETDAWCTPADATISTVAPGFATAPFCVNWDGVYHSIPFTPNSVTQNVVCNDPAPTWIYEIDPAPIDTKFIKIAIDSTTNMI